MMRMNSTQTVFAKSSITTLEYWITKIVITEIMLWASYAEVNVDRNEKTL